MSDAPAPAPAQPDVEPVRPAQPAPPGVPVCGADELADGEAAEFLIDGFPVALARVDGTWFAIENECPHAGGPLGDGALDGTQLACPWHGWGFDVTTGVCAVDPSLTVATFSVQVHDGQVWVDRPASS